MDAKTPTTQKGTPVPTVGCVSFISRISLTVFSRNPQFRRNSKESSLDMTFSVPFPSITILLYFMFILCSLILIECSRIRICWYPPYETSSGKCWCARECHRLELWIKVHYLQNVVFCIFYVFKCLACRCCLISVLHINHSSRETRRFLNWMSTFRSTTWHLRTKDASTAPMTGLKSVMFFDNDTLLWSNSSSYSPVSSQFVIAIYNEGFILIDYIAQTATEVRNAM